MKKLLGVSFVLVLVLILFFYLSSQKNMSPFLHAATSPSGKEPLTNAIINLSIQKNKLVKSPQVVNVKEGQMIILKITSDDDGELHFLGYNKHIFLQKGKTVILSFLATLTGHFDYELEKTKTALGTVNVIP